MLLRYINYGAIIFSIVVIFFIHAPVTAQDDMVVVINKNAPDITRMQVQQMFKGNLKYWPTGSPVKILLNSNGNIYQNFAQKYLNMDSSRLDSIWVRQSIKNGVPKPRMMKSQVILMLVGNSNLFISFVKRSEVKGNIKIIN